MKHVLITNELNQPSAKFDLKSTKGLTKYLLNKHSILNGARYFSAGVCQRYLVFISANKYIDFFCGTQEIYLWKPKGISEESIKNLSGSNNTFAPSLIDYRPLPDGEFGGNCLTNI